MSAARETGFRTVSLPVDVLDRIDDFIAKNRWGFRSRADVINQAVREFIKREMENPETKGR